MLYNFATASVSRADMTARMEALQQDVLRILDAGGISAFEAEAKFRGEAAAIIRQQVQDVYATFDPTPIFTERRTGSHGDTYEFEELIPTGRVVEYSPQSQPQIFTPRKGKWTINTTKYEMAFGIPMEKVMNRQHTVGEFVTMAGEAQSRFYSNLTMTAVDTACAVGATDVRGRPLRTAAAGPNVQKTEIDAALRRMYAGNGGGLTIFGSRYAVDPLFDLATQGSFALTDELQARGVLGGYRGAKIVEVRDDHNLFYQSFAQVNGIPLEKLLFISSGTPGAILMDKDMSNLAWQKVDPRSAQWAQGTRLECGILVHTPARYHVVQLA